MKLFDNVKVKHSLTSEVDKLAVFVYKFAFYTFNILMITG